MAEPSEWAEREARRLLSPPADTSTASFRQTMERFHRDVAEALDAARQRGRDSAKAELAFYKEREEHFAHALKVADGGQYRADWDGAIRRLVDERDAGRRLRERIEKMAEREERYRLDATQRLDDLDAASYDRAARVLRSLLTDAEEVDRG